MPDTLRLTIGTAGLVGTLSIVPWSFGMEAAVVLLVAVIPTMAGVVVGYASTRRLRDGDGGRPDA